MKLAIVGSRHITRFDLSKYIDVKEINEIVSGGARGIDTIAKLFAIQYKIPITEYLPDYKRHGRGAPLRRNHLIVEHADKVLAIIKGECRGTEYTIEAARKLGKPVEVEFEEIKTLEL